jgi:hypothetical protein
VTILIYRNRSGRQNLYDTETAATRNIPVAESERHLTARTADGTHNDLGSPRTGSAGKLTDNPIWAAEMGRLYKGDVDRVDLMVGMFAESKPEGFGFSDTAFRIFILMASRRLNSDRFFTTDFTPEVYTQVGLDWIDDNDMSTVLLRHFPELGPSLRGTRNAFAPWQRVRT